MSKLPRAPLIEVIFELRWNSSNPAELANFQYLHGDLYALLKTDYSFRESLIPPNILQPIIVNTPVYRFWKAKDEYPIVQIGPGVITVNTTDKEYYWEDYFQRCTKLSRCFFDVHKSTNDQKFRPVLIYLDFFAFDFEKDDVITFINENLHIHLRQEFFKPEKHNSAIGLSFSYQTEIGVLEVKLNSGNNNDNTSGLILQTQMNGPSYNNTPEDIENWLNRAHDFCSDLFKQMTAGLLAKSFE